MITRERGAAAVETAILAAFLIVLVLGIVDVGRAIFTRIALEDAAQAGASYASLTESATDVAIKNVVVDSISSPTLETWDVTVSCTNDTTGSRTSHFVEVEVMISQDLITPGASSLAGPLNISASASAERFVPGVPCSP